MVEVEDEVWTAWEGVDWDWVSKVGVLTCIPFIFRICNCSCMHFFKRCSFWLFVVVTLRFCFDNLWRWRRVSLRVPACACACACLIESCPRRLRKHGSVFATFPKFFSFNSNQVGTATYYCSSHANVTRKNMLPFVSLLHVLCAYWLCDLIFCSVKRVRRMIKTTLWNNQDYKRY